MIFFDTETCGFQGPIVLLQWAEDDGPIQLELLWHKTVNEAIAILDKVINNDVCGFNLAFDWFHVAQMYTILLRLKDRFGEVELEDIISEYVKEEPLARDGPCVKPKSACDLMLHARKGKYQSTMDRKPIRIKRVPTLLADSLCLELQKRIPLNDIYFIKRKKHDRQWKIQETDNPDFVNVYLKFAASSSLKALAVDALGVKNPLTFNEIDSKFYPEELGYAPYALALPDSKWTWPYVIKFHINHWQTNEAARQYAYDDVDYTRRLWYNFGLPASGDDDSELACMVGANKWRGYTIDVAALKKLRDEEAAKIRDVPTAPAKARFYIEQVASPEEIVGMGGSTKKVVLEALSKITDENNNTTPAALRAKEILDARRASYSKNLYDKLIRAGRLHAEVKVIGTLSSRMAGGRDKVESAGRGKSGSINPQGISKLKTVRKCFTYKHAGENLDGGDFDGFEITLADAAYNDPQLRADLQSGKKIHALFGMSLFPNETYESIIASAKSEFDMYDLGKRGVFSMIYGGDANTLVTKLGIELEVAEAGRLRFIKRYPGVGRAQRRIINNFCSMRQPGGIGTNVEWHDPEDSMPSLLGFKRFFTLENQICKALFDLANSPPKEWRKVKVQVQRRERLQTVSGALQSALYGCAFQIQAMSMRAAANHEIQSSGAQITKHVQRRIWDIQPSGVNDWIVQPMNIHDEIMCPTNPTYSERVRDIVYNAVETFRDKVPLLKLEWKYNLSDWSSK